MFIVSCHSFSCEEYIKKNILHKRIAGVIREKRETSACFGVVHFNADSLEICTCSNQEAWNIIAIGDSLSKNNDTDSFIIFRNAIPKKSFKYVCCDQ